MKSNNNRITNTRKEKIIQRQTKHGIELSNKIINNLLLNPVCLKILQ